jgi:tRNA-binding EMAP/Myf-like protein
MLVSLKWLREYLDPAPASLSADPEGLAHRLTLASAEVEGIQRVGGWDRDRVVVGEVLAVEPHPNADRLRLATVNHGLPSRSAWSAARRTSRPASASPSAARARCSSTGTRARAPS